MWNFSIYYIDLILQISTIRPHKQIHSLSVKYAASDCHDQNVIFNIVHTNNNDIYVVLFQ